MPKNKPIIYLDNNATTPIDCEVLESMMPYFKGDYANANSTHVAGIKAHQAVDISRNKVGELIGAEPSEIVFTSGATESINLAIKGYAISNSIKGMHIVAIQTEHKAVLDTCKYLETIGFEVSYLKVNREGFIDLNDLRQTIRPSTLMVCAMFVNNEIGVIQPITEISKIIHESNALFFCDATQAVGKLNFNVNKLEIDLMAFSGHKFYGPKGIGALYIRNRARNKIKIEAQIHGGGHEYGIRSGTLNVPLIVGLGKASEIALKSMKKDEVNISILRDELESELIKIRNTFVNGSRINRIYNVTSICFPGFDANVLIGRMKNIAVSNGSACSSLFIEPSHVLKAIGLSDEDALSSIRFSLGKFNTKEEIKIVYETLRQYTKNELH